eukprot:4950492-Prymnesium_polylepis.1
MPWRSCGAAGCGAICERAERAAPHAIDPHTLVKLCGALGHIAVCDCVSDGLSVSPCALDARRMDRSSGRRTTVVRSCQTKRKGGAMGDPTPKCGHTYAGDFAGHEDANRHGTE